MTVSKRLRFEILKRDGHTCRYCGGRALDVPITVDHVIPTALGGSDEPTNLVAACMDCNGGKSSVPPDASLVADVADDALRMAEAMRHLAALRSVEIRQRLDVVPWFLEQWGEWTRYDEPYETDIPNFLQLGLTVDDIEELIILSARSRVTDRWRYFCGCCWKRIRSVQEQAIALAAGDKARSAATDIDSAGWDAALRAWRGLLREHPHFEFDRVPIPCIHAWSDKGSLAYHCGDPVCVIGVTAVMWSCFEWGTAAVTEVMA